MTALHLSKQRLAGQRLMVGFDGTELNAELKYLIDTFNIGGVILFKPNITSPPQLRKLCASIQDYARSWDLPHLFITVDQEGGQVARLKAPFFTEFPGNPHMRGRDDARLFARTTATELLGAGFNMNMAPVLDVAFDKADSIMAERSFGSDPAWVSELGGAVIQGLQRGNIMAVAKHFPGIGRTTLDSHVDKPVLAEEMAVIEDSDLVPFTVAIERGVAGIMLSHVVYSGIDDQWPASLSPSVARTLLRERLGYKGLVFTDDLDMGAIKKHIDIPTAVRQILKADIDVALICHKGPDIETAHREILRGINRSADLKDRAQVCAQRILNLKKGYGLA